MKTVILGLSMLIFAGGCTMPGDLSGSCESSYPELPDNARCFQKIAEYRAFTMNPENSGMNVPYSPAAYLGILKGRGAVEERLIAVTPDQARMFFRNQTGPLPDFLLEVTGTCDPDPTRSRVIVCSYRSESREEFEKWLEERMPGAAQPCRDIPELFREKHPDCVVLEPLSPQLIEYEWKLRQGDIGKVEGLERLMKGASPELAGYVAQMRKWAESDQKSPPIIGDREQWKQFRELARKNQPFYCVEIFRKDGVTRETRSILLLDHAADVVWRNVLESVTRSSSGNMAAGRETQSK